MSVTTSHNIVYTLSASSCEVTDVLSFAQLSYYILYLFPQASLGTGTDTFVFATELTETEMELFGKLMEKFPNSYMAPSGYPDITGGWNNTGADIYIKFDKNTNQGTVYDFHSEWTPELVPNGFITAISSDTFICKYIDSGNYPSTPHTLTVTSSTQMVVSNGQTWTLIHGGNNTETDVFYNVKITKVNENSYTVSGTLTKEQKNSFLNTFNVNFV
jgi:hypothetical protein